jgi:hypothetical protein
LPRAMALGIREVGIGLKKLSARCCSGKNKVGWPQLGETGFFCNVWCNVGRRVLEACCGSVWQSTIPRH